MSVCVYVRMYIFVQMCMFVCLVSESQRQDSIVGSPDVQMHSGMPV